MQNHGSSLAIIGNQQAIKAIFDNHWQSTGKQSNH
jgi:hypothetical protein